MANTHYTHTEQKKMDRSNELKENSVFLEVLENYKFILKRSHDKRSRNKYRAARLELTKEFNKKCNANLSVKQTQRKLNNFKFRCREKHYQSLKRNEKPRFSTVERKFLSLWGDNEIEECCKKKLRGAKGNSEDGGNQCILQESSQFIEDSSINPNTDSLQQNQLPTEDFKSENDFDGTTLDDCHTIKVEPISLTETTTPVNTWQIESDSDSEKSLLQHKHDDAFGNMSFDELKREVLISQIKMYKATEDSARATEKLKLYKLSLLQRSNGNLPKWL